MAWLRIFSVFGRKDGFFFHSKRKVMLGVFHVFGDVDMCVVVCACASERLIDGLLGSCCLCLPRYLMRAMLEGAEWVIFITVFLKFCIKNFK